MAEQIGRETLAQIVDNQSRRYRGENAFVEVVGRIRRNLEVGAGVLQVGACGVAGVLAIRRGVRGLAGDRSLAGSRARRVGERDVVVEGDAELGDPEDQHDEDREHHRELRHGLASFVFHYLGLVRHVVSFGSAQGPRRRGRAPPHAWGG